MSSKEADFSIANKIERDLKDKMIESTKKQLLQLRNEISSSKAVEELKKAESTLNDRISSS